MTKVVNLATVLPCRPRVAIDHVETPHLLQYVAWPLMRFVPVSPPAFPARWEEKPYLVSLYLLGFIPFGRQAISISRVSTEPFTFRDNGHSRLIRQWDHVITICEAEGGTLYRDRVTINAGVLTGLVWLFAQLFFRHRQRRWKQLALDGFRYPNRKPDFRTPDS